jgi:class 3 adenylate cyclase/uncharacterized PurR-regulated membrane protein YhhQ (DUF165 family)
MLAARFLIELALLTSAVCTAHALRDRLGTAALHVLLGALIVLLFVAGAGEPKIATALIFSEAVKLNTLFFLPPILAAVVVTYALDGTRATRRLFGVIAFIYAVDTIIRVVLVFHAEHPPPGWPAFTGFHAVLSVALHSKVASLIALLVDSVIIVVVFQLLRNRASFVPMPIGLALGFVAAMVSDAFTFELLRFGTLAQIPLLEKLEVAMVAALPLSAYLTWQMRGGAPATRGAFDIVDLRAQVLELETRYTWVRDSFSKYVSRDVVDRLLADPSKIELGGELREVTVLFADVRGYSTLSEKLDPREVIRILNEYFGTVGALVLEHEGMINEFEGDGILAVFGAPAHLEDHALKAVRCAEAMLEAVKQLNERWRQDGTLAHFQRVGLDEIGTRVGVHTGVAVAGNIGTGTRIKYAVIGDTVNTAARVEGLVKSLGESLLFTEATRHHLPPGFAVVDKGAHAVKGRAQEVHVYGLG